MSGVKHSPRHLDHHVSADFGARVRAAAAYMNLSLPDFAALVDRPGLSAATMRKWQRGHMPPLMAQRAIVERLSEVSGLPAEFFAAQAEAEAA